MENQLQHQEDIANNLQTFLAGKVEEPVAKRAVEALASTTGKHPASGGVSSFIFYLKWGIDIKGGKRFVGDSGGVSTPGGGALIGDVYTDNLDRLYRDTVSFQFTATSVYTSLIFFDKDANVLGTFQAGAVSTVNGIGGGSGSWS